MKHSLMYSNSVNKMLVSTHTFVQRKTFLLYETQLYIECQFPFWINELSNVAFVVSMTKIVDQMSLHVWFLWFKTMK